MGPGYLMLHIPLISWVQNFGVKISVKNFCNKVSLTKFYQQNIGNKISEKKTCQQYLGYKILANLCKYAININFNVPTERIWPHCEPLDLIILDSYLYCITSSLGLLTDIVFLSIFKLWYEKCFSPKLILSVAMLNI